MSTVKVLAGDIPTGTAAYVKGHIRGIQLASVEIATEQNLKKAGGTIAGALAGGLLLGPLGAIGGMLLGGNKKETVFIASFTNNQKALIKSDANIFTQIQADIFNGPCATPTQINSAEMAPFMVGFIIFWLISFFILKNFMWTFVAIFVAMLPGFIMAAVVGFIFMSFCGTPKTKE